METFAELATKNPESKFIEKVKSVEAEQENFVIKTDDDYQVAKDRLIAATKLEKEISETFDPIVKKAHETHKEATEQRRKFLDPAQMAKKFYQRLIGAYDQQKEAARRAEEFRINEERRKKIEAEQLKKAEALEASGFMEEADAVIEQKIDFVPVHIEPEEKDSGIVYRDNWNAEVIDESKVPREYLIVDIKKLNQMAKAIKGESTIPGVRFVNNRTSYVK